MQLALAIQSGLRHQVFQICNQLFQIIHPYIIYSTLTPLVFDKPSTMVFNWRMATTAKELSARAHATIDSMARLPQYRSKSALYREIAKYSGLSVSLIRQFHSGAKPNLTVETLDMLSDGLALVNRLAA